MAVDVGADVLGHLALQEVWDADRELDDLETAGHLAERVVMGLAVLGRDQLSDLVGALLQQELELVEDPRAPQRRCLRPSRPGRFGHRDDLAHLLICRQRHPLLHRASRWVEDIREAAGACLPELRSWA